MGSREPSAEGAYRKRRYRSKQERRLIVEETLVPGVSVAIVARAHEVNANQVFHWRKLYQQGLLESDTEAAKLLPVRISEAIQSEPRYSRSVATATIQIDLGRAKLRLEGVSVAEVLRTIMERVLG